MFKRLCSLLLVMTLLAALCAGTVSAAGDSIGPVSDSSHGFGLLSSEPSLTIGEISDTAPTLNEPAYRTSTEKAGADLRSAMKNRQTTAQVGLRTTSVSEEELEYWAYEILAWATAHTGIGAEGDYLSWTCAVDSISVDGYAEGSYAYLTYTYTLAYATSASQENQVTQKVQSILSALDVADADDYTKVSALYDYLCSNVTYTGIPNENAPTAEFCAYGALMNGRANSYGFSHLFYRLALELGLDCRMIAGVIGEDEVFWNIVLVDMYYYNVDAALDAGKTEYQYFLKCDDSFSDHLRYEEYASEDFYEYYPMDPVDYDGDELTADGGTCGEGVEWVIGHRGTLIIYGDGAMDHYTEEGVGHESPSSIPWNKYKEFIRIIVVDEGVTTIGRGSFNSCPGLHTVAIAGTVQTLTEYAFQNCTALTTVVLSEGLTAIDIKAFSGCDRLTEIILPSTLQSIGSEAFYLSDLKSITVPAAVTFIDETAFQSCYQLEEIIVEEGNRSYTSVDGVLYDAEVRNLIKCPEGKVGQLTIPDSVVSMPEYSCAQTEYLTDVVIGSGLETIPEGAFWYSGLTSITFGENVKEILESAFNGCQNLTTLRFLGSAPVIEWYALSNVTATAYYPAGDPTWTQEAMDQAGSNITWIAECLNHTGELQGATEPTCTKDGYTGDEVCVSCGELFSKGSVIPAKGHNFKDGFCTVCGRGEAVRLSGSSRVSTAIAVADKLKEVLGRESFDTIIIANGDNFADALTGSYLASVKEAPILLYRGNEIALNEEYIRNNLNEDGIVYILGGTSAVPANVEESLKTAGYNVVRLSGSTRFDTNLKILEAAGVEDEEILICTGWDYADSLSASATGLPIVMLNTIADKLTDNQIAFFEEFAGNRFTIVGGNKAVSEKLEADIEAIVGDVNRIYGDGREETAVEVAESYFRNPEYVLVAFSRNFPDGLCGGPLAHAMQVPLLLVNAGMEAPAADYVKENGIARGFILGGTAAVSDASVEVIFGE